MVMVRPVCIENLIHEYLKSYGGWDKKTIRTALRIYKAVHGQKAVEAMERFIRQAEDRKKTTGFIACNLAHDLNCCADKEAVPRTIGF